MKYETNFKIAKILAKTFGTLILLFLILLALQFTFGDNTQPVPQVIHTEAEKSSFNHNIWIEDQFSKFDGRHIKLVQLIKPKLNDPSSFEHVETRYSKQGEDIIVFMTYRAKNQYGGVMLGNIKAKVCYSNDVIEIL